jgi:hypothetical protein
VIAGLADKTPLGTVVRSRDDWVERKVKKVTVGNGSPTQAQRDALTVGVEYPFPRCDLRALYLSAVEGCPRIELYWPVTRRDEAVAACAAYLKRFGPLLTADLNLGQPDAAPSNPRLNFPTLGTPATAADVAANRAIFSLEGQGETRLVKLPGWPQPARWLTLKASPLDVPVDDGVSRREYDPDGYVWQAEEVRKGDHWERYYGFVGRHTIARAPADEIELGEPYLLYWKLKGGRVRRHRTGRAQEKGVPDRSTHRGNDAPSERHGGRSFLLDRVPPTWP